MVPYIGKISRVPVPLEGWVGWVGWVSLQEKLRMHQEFGILSNP